MQTRLLLEREDIVEIARKMKQAAADQVKVYADMLLDSARSTVLRNYLIAKGLAERERGRSCHGSPSTKRTCPGPWSPPPTLCIATRIGQGSAYSGSTTLPAPNKDSVLSVARITFLGPKGDSARIDRIRYAHVPKRASVHLPFVDPEGGSGEYLIQQKGGSVIQIWHSRLPPEVNGERVLYNSLTQWIGGIYVSKGEVLIASVKIRR